MNDNGIATDSMQTVFCFRESIHAYLHFTTFPHLQTTRKIVRYLAISPLVSWLLGA